MMRTSIDRLCNLTNNIGIFVPRKLKFIFLIENPDLTFINETRTEGFIVTNPDPMIVIESRTEGIKFERHKKEILNKFTSSLKNQ
jgi:hypothetical protein